MYVIYRCVAGVDLSGNNDQTEWGGGGRCENKNLRIIYIDRYRGPTRYQTKRRRRPNVYLMFGHCLRRWPTNKYTSVQHRVFCITATKQRGGGPRVVVSTAAFHARVRGSVPGLGGLKETKMFLPHPRVKVSIVGSLRDREVACSASDRQGSNFESCVWRTVSSQSSHHPQEVLLAQFSLYVHKGGLKPDSFHFFTKQRGVNQTCI